MSDFHRHGVNKILSPHPGLFLQSGHHDDGVGSLLPHHPPEVAQCLWQRPLRGNVGILLPVAVDVVGIDVVTAWNGFNDNEKRGFQIVCLSGELARKQ